MKRPKMYWISKDFALAFDVLLRKIELRKASWDRAAKLWTKIDELYKSTEDT